MYGSFSLKMFFVLAIFQANRQRNFSVFNQPSSNLTKWKCKMKCQAVEGGLLLYFFLQNTCCGAGGANTVSSPYSMSNWQYFSTIWTISLIASMVTKYNLNNSRVSLTSCWTSCYATPNECLKWHRSGHAATPINSVIKALPAVQYKAVQGINTSINHNVSRQRSPLTWADYVPLSGTVSSLQHQHICSQLFHWLSMCAHEHTSNTNR